MATPEASSIVNVAVVGAGWWAAEHAKAVQAVPCTRLVGFSSRNPERIANFKKQFDVEAFDDYRRMLERPEIDAVAISVPHDAHATVAIEALDAGKHVLLEKPMARDRAECAAIAAAARRSSKLFMVGFTHHWNPQVRRAKQLVEAGEIGAVIQGFCSLTLTWEWWRRPRFYLDRALGGGMWLTMGVHFVDRLLWLVPSEVVSVKGVIDRRFHPIEEHQADDAATALLHYRSGAAGAILLSGYRTGPLWNETRIIGEKGTLKIDGGALTRSDGDQWQRVEVEERAYMEAEWDDFARAIQAGGPSPISLEYALRVMEVVFSAEASAAAGREVPLEPIRV